MLKKYIAREPEVDVVHISNKDDATIAVARVIYQDTDPELVKVPTTNKQMRSFLGFLGYYREHIPGFAEISALVSDLLKKED